MIHELHHDDDSLIALAGEEFAADDHLSACPGCRDRLETFRLIAGALRDEATWDTTPFHDAPVPETIATLRAFADRMADEDAYASILLPDLLMGPREMWMSNLQRHPEYRTAGMVRRLLEAVPAALHTMPRDAVELTALATAISDHLEDATPQLRGAAWRERAYSLFYTGDFSAAEEALCASERHFNESKVSEYDLARVGVVRALVEKSLEKYPSATANARESAALFRRYADTTKHVSAKLAEIHLLMSCCEYEQAYSSLISLRNQLISGDKLHDYARVVSNLGHCCCKLGRIDEALQYLDAAARIFEEVGNHSDGVRVRWNAARVLAEVGRATDALQRLEAVYIEFDRLGMMASATQASVELAELLVTQGAFDRAEEICRFAIRRLEASKLTYTAPALTALAVMHEAVRNRTATTKLVSHVREYIRRVPEEPHLLFAFPPE